MVEYLQEKQPKRYLQNNGLDIGESSWGHWWHFSEIIRIWRVVIKIYREGMDKVNMEFLLNKSLKLLKEATQDFSIDRRSFL